MEKKPPFVVTRENWWKRVGELPPFCLPLRTAINVFLTPGYHSTRLARGQVDRIIEEVGTHIVVDGTHLRITLDNGEIRLKRDGELTVEEWGEIWGILNGAAQLIESSDAAKATQYRFLAGQVRHLMIKNL